MQCLYVLFDDRCGLCRWARRWAEGQSTYLPLVFVAAGSDAALRMFPGVSKPGVPEELIVVSDEGHVYRADAAWIMCLYALTEYREWSSRLATPALRPLARRAFALVSKQRTRIYHWLAMSDDETAERLKRVVVAPCEYTQAASALHRVSGAITGDEPHHA